MSESLIRLCEIARFTDCVGALTRFYRDLLGVEPLVETGELTIFVSAGVKLLIHARYEAAAGELPCEDHVAFAVPDCVRACSRLEAAGWRIEVEPADYDWGRSAYLRDPSGRLVELTEEPPRRVDPAPTAPSSIPGAG